MKIRVDDFFINLILVIGVGIPLIFWGVLDTWRTILTILIILVSVIYIFKHGIRKTESSSFLYIYIFVLFPIYTPEYELCGVLVHNNNLLDTQLHYRYQKRLKKHKVHL